MKHCGMYSLSEAAKLMGVRVQSIYHHRKHGRFTPGKCSPYAIDADGLKAYVKEIDKAIKNSDSRPPKKVSLPEKMRECVGCSHLIGEKEAMKRAGLTHGSLMFRMHAGKLDGHYMPCQKLMFDPESIERDRKQGHIRTRHALLYPRIGMLKDRLGDRGDIFSYKEMVKKSVAAMIKEKKLDEREQLILNSRLGLDGSAPKSLQEIGDKYGITRERIRQLESRALFKIGRYRGV